MLPSDLTCALPDFKYDHDSLVQIADTYLTPEYRDLQICYTDDEAFPDNAYREYTHDSGYCRWCMLFFKDLPEDFSELPLIQDIAELFSFCDSQSTPEKVYENLFFFDIWGELPFHKDNPYRSFGFNIPIVGCSEPTQWWSEESNTLLHEADFSGPMMINTEVMHGCPANTGQRLFLSLDGFTESLSDVTQTLIDQGKITHIT
jgi:hypothetical protein